MDINPKRTLVVVALASLVSGGVLYYQDSSYSPSAELEARDAVDKASKGGRAAIIPKPKSGEGTAGVVPAVANAGPSPTPATGVGLFASGGGFGDEVGPKMAKAIQARAEREGKKGSSSGGRGSSSGGSSGGGSSGGGSSGGGSSGGGSSGGGGSAGGGGGGGEGEGNPSEDTGYWLDEGTNIRHNSSCDFYKAEQGRAGGGEEGTACRRCGG